MKIEYITLLGKEFLHSIPNSIEEEYVATKLANRYNEVIQEVNRLRVLVHGEDAELATCEVYPETKSGRYEAACFTHKYAGEIEHLRRRA